MFGINVESLVKDEVVKFDADAPAQILKLEGYLTTAGTFLSKFTAADLELIIASLPAPVAAKIPAELVTEVASMLTNLPADITEAKAELEKIRTALA